MASTTTTPQIDERTLPLRNAYVELMAADRRLRGREHVDLSFIQVRALVQLLDRGELTAGEFAKAAEITPASATGMLDQLEEAGIVVRARDAADRRRVVVSMTAHGHELVTRKRERWSAVWAEALDGVSDRDMAGATLVMGRLADVFNAM